MFEILSLSALVLRIFGFCRDVLFSLGRWNQRLKSVFRHLVLFYFCEDDVIL